MALHARCCAETEVPRRPSASRSPSSFMTPTALPNLAFFLHHYRIATAGRHHFLASGEPPPQFLTPTTPPSTHLSPDPLLPHNTQAPQRRAPPATAAVRRNRLSAVAGMEGGRFGTPRALLPPTLHGRWCVGNGGILWRAQLGWHFLARQHHRRTAATAVQHLHQRV